MTSPVVTQLLTLGSKTTTPLLTVYAKMLVVLATLLEGMSKYEVKETAGDGDDCPMPTLAIDWIPLAKSILLPPPKAPPMEYVEFQRLMEETLNQAITQFQAQLTALPMGKHATAVSAAASMAAAHHAGWCRAPEQEALAPSSDPAPSRPFHDQKYALSLTNPNGTTSFSSCNVAPFHPEKVAPGSLCVGGLCRALHLK
jgi:hypothetical protein